MPRAIAERAAQGVLTLENLYARCEEYPLGTVPDGVRFLIGSGDVQGNRFVIQIEGFGDHLERWIVDRFDIALPDLKPGQQERALNPAAYAEDWQLLRTKVLEKAWPLAGNATKAMMLKLFVYDIHGRDGVTGQAYDFYRDLKRRRVHDRALPLRGVGGFKVPRVALTYPDSERKDRYAGARGEIPVLQVGVDQVKDFVMGGLRRDQPGPQYIHIPKAMALVGLSENVVEPDRDQLSRSPLAEYLAEVRGDKGWVREVKRNEAFDLSAYCTAAALRLRADEMPWDHPERLPNWLRKDGNPLIITVSAASAEAGPVDISSGTATSNDKSKKISAMVSRLA